MFRPLLEREGIRYQKNTNVFARPAKPGEVVHTHTADGLETSNRAEAADFLVRNQTASGEAYLLPGHKFSKKYAFLRAMDEEWSEYRALGEIIAVELTPERLETFKLPGEFQFIAPWDSPMVAKAGDFLASPFDYSELYRIARKEFFETYVLL